MSHELTVIALLRLANEQGLKGLLRTSLAKYLYLLDYYSAAYQAGSTWTGWEWRFVHFGPFAGAVADEIGRAVASGRVTEEASPDKNYVLYRLSGVGETPTLKEIGVHRGAALRLQIDVGRYGNELPRLLDYVYFGTVPMERAEPGETLSFSQIDLPEAKAFYPIKMRPLAAASIDKARELIKRSAVGGDDLRYGPFDEVYEKGIAELEGDLKLASIKGSARVRK